MSAKTENEAASVLRLDLKAGDKPHVVEAADRVLKLSPCDPTHADGL